MNRNAFSLKYMLLTYRLDMLWLPAAFLALFIILAVMLRGQQAGFAVTTGYLGAALPLIAGVLGAYAVLEDPALELQFATPRPVWLMLGERLGLIVVLSTVCAFSYQGVLVLFQIDLSSIGSFGMRQLAWISPTLAMLALGATIAFLNRNSTAGTAVVGMVWIFEILMRDWFLQDRWAQYFLLIMGSNYPTHPALRANQAALIGLAGLLLVAAWALLRREERYI